MELQKSFCATRMRSFGERSEIPLKEEIPTATYYWYLESMQLFGMPNDQVAY